MYITIHRLRSHQGRIGVNAFLYLHGDEPIPTTLDEDAEGEVPPGPPIASVIQIPPGGNMVDSYLDLVGPDNVDHEALSEILLRAAAQLSAEPTERQRKNHLFFTLGNFQFRFYLSDRMATNPVSEFTQFANIARRLFKEREHPERETLIIQQQHHDDRYIYRLSDESLEVIHAAEMSYHMAPISIQKDVLRMLEDMRGPFLEEVPALLVDPSLEVATLFSNVKILDSAGDTILERQYLM